jgi:hypothetical protein
VDFAIGLEAMKATRVYAGRRSGIMPIRDQNHRWYISPIDYRNRTLPRYNSGYAVLFSLDAVQEIYRASFHVPRVYGIPRRTFPIEDIFTGICAKYAKINLMQLTWMCLCRFAVYEAAKTNKCALLKVMAVHQVPFQKMAKLRRQFKQLTTEEIKMCRMKEIPIPRECSHRLHNSGRPGMP